MLYEFILAEKNVKKPMYQQIYLSVRKAIENGTLKKGSKLPSLRKLSVDLGISKTTVISAYDQLCAEGYIENKPQSGYYVAAQFENAPKGANSDFGKQNTSKYYEYDFSGKSIDEKIIDIAEWKKNIKDIINRNYLMTSYGDAQGEEALRTALQKYAAGIRSVNAQADNIVVGAGTQAVLFLLCSIIGFGKRIAMEKLSFVQSEFVFKSFDYDIYYFDCDEFGATVDSLERIQPEIILLNPNFSGTRGDNMPVTRRLELIEWAKAHDALIIEDDYNGELRYRTRPTPCIQNYDIENTIYIGSFSKVLLPSVRISYTVLPEKLLEIYKTEKKKTNQTASKTEQLALAKYIENGKIEAHLRRARRVYLEKSRLLLDCLNKYMPKAELHLNETSLYLTVKPPFEYDRSTLEKELEAKSVRLMTYQKDEKAIALSFSGISPEKLENGVKLICEAVIQSKI